MSKTTTIALVTGANKGIGRAVAKTTHGGFHNSLGDTILTCRKINADVQVLKALARDHGFIVIIGSRQAAAGVAMASELSFQGHQATSVQLDISSDESIANAVKTIDQKYGRLDVLINNAGVLLDHANDKKPNLPIRELYNRTFETNVIGTACLTAALVPLLRKARGGSRVVFMSSVMGSLTHTLNEDLPWYHMNCTAYDSSKAAINMLALNYVRLLADVGGRVNTACPGLVSSDLTNFSEHGTSPEVGAEHIVNLATASEGGLNGTFSNKSGPIPW